MTSSHEAAVSAGSEAPAAGDAPNLDEVDLTDPSTYHRPDMDAVWDRLRREHPVFWHRAAARGFWVISRHADVAGLYRDNRRLSVAPGNMLVTLLNGGDPATGRMIAVSEGPTHAQLRSAIVRGFSARVLAAIGDKLHRYASELVAQAVEAGDIDFAEAVADKIPVNTICDLLGVPDADRPHLLDLNKRTVSSSNPVQEEHDSRSARTDLVLYLADLAETRQKRPGDDVISTLATTSIDGTRLSSYDVAVNAYSLILGGDQTSRLTMISAAHALAVYPDQWRLLRDGGVAVGTATEEVVRWATPIMHLGRTAVEDIGLRGETIRAGDIVTLWNCSANRDPAAFRRPDQFDLSRSPNKHLAFGAGPHFCVGTQLARAEITALLEALTEHVGAVELRGPGRRIYSDVAAGFSHLPVRLLAR